MIMSIIHAEATLYTTQYNLKILPFTCFPVFR
ncbi:hypothetical protein EZS27_035173, partial [termite gut metagenome]